MSAPTEDAVARVRDAEVKDINGGRYVLVRAEDRRAVLARLAECERGASPVVAAFIAPDTSLWQGALVNVCADGSWWARPASLGEDAPWERQAVPLDHAMRGGV